MIREPGNIAVGLLLEGVEDSRMELPAAVRFHTGLDSQPGQLVPEPHVSWSR